MGFLTNVQATKKTFADYLFDDVEATKKKIDQIESEVRNMYNDRPDVEIYLEIASRLMKKDTSVPNWVKSCAMETYDRLRKNEK
jgi:hypothetical protein